MIMKRATLLTGLVLALFLGACRSIDPAADRFGGAQSLVNDTASRHSDVERLSLHAIPSGETRLITIASTDAARRGRRADPEDLDALRYNRSIKMREGKNLDVTVPLIGRSGAPVAIAGITVSLGGDSAEEEMEAEATAMAVAEEMAQAIRESGSRLW